MFFSIGIFRHLMKNLIGMAFSPVISTGGNKKWHSHPKISLSIYQ